MWESESLQLGRTCHLSRFVSVQQGFLFLERKVSLFSQENILKSEEEWENQ
jgi:hypothetical protein